MKEGFEDKATRLHKNVFERIKIRLKSPNSNLREISFSIFFGKVMESLISENVSFYNDPGSIPADIYLMI